MNSRQRNSILSSGRKDSVRGTHHVLEVGERVVDCDDLDIVVVGRSTGDHLANAPESGTHNWGRAREGALCEVQNTKYSHSFVAWRWRSECKGKGHCLPIDADLDHDEFVVGVSLGSAHARDVREWKLCEPRVCGSCGHSPHSVFNDQLCTHPHTHSLLHFAHLSKGVGVGKDATTLLVSARKSNSNHNSPRPHSPCHPLPSNAKAGAF
jgi:hypothetical protein